MNHDFTFVFSILRLYISPVHERRRTSFQSPKEWLSSERARDYFFDVMGRIPLSLQGTADEDCLQDSPLNQSWDSHRFTAKRKLSFQAVPSLSQSLNSTMLRNVMSPSSKSQLGQLDANRCRPELTKGKESNPRTFSPSSVAKTYPLVSTDSSVHPESRSYDGNSSQSLSKKYGQRCSIANSPKTRDEVHMTSTRRRPDAFQGHVVRMNSSNRPNRHFVL